MKNPCAQPWLTWTWLCASVFAAGCKSTEITSRISTQGAVQVTPMEYAAMTPEARAKGNFVIADDHPIPGKTPEAPSLILKTPTIPTEDKVKETHEVSYDALNKARMPQN